MARRSAEVLAKIVELVDADILRIRSEYVGRRLDAKASGTVAEYLRAMAFADRNLATAEEKDTRDTAGMTDEELDTQILEHADEIRRKRGSAGK